MKKSSLQYIIVALLLLSVTLWARQPRELPGEELSHDVYMSHLSNVAIHKDTAKKRVLTPLYDDPAFKTWSAPPIVTQIGRDTIAMKLGLGALFIPRMSEDGAIEPNIAIYDIYDKRVASGKTGQKYNLLPGNYIVKIGKTANFRITKEVTIKEGKITPIIPDWCGIRIEVINENAKPIRGEYDLAKLSPLTPVGRGRGRDIDLAEDISVWLLPAGTYKIIGAGASYNSIGNFLTVRLSPGEFTRYTVVQNDLGKIVGGGILIEDAEGHKEKYWRHNINIGGSLDLNFHDDRVKDTIDNKVSVSFLMYDRINYKREKVEWSSLLKVDLNLTNEDMKISKLKSSVDELRFNTLFTYRLFPRFGPYCRGEYLSGLLPESVESPASEGAAEGLDKHYFIMYQKIPTIVDDDTPVMIDSTSKSQLLQPIFSPINLQTGFGGNVQVFQNRFVSMRFLSGLGFAFERRWNEKDLVEDKDIVFDVGSDIYQKYYANEVSHNNLVHNNSDRFDYGPEFMLNTALSLTRFLSIDSDLRFFSPLGRMYDPDLDLRNLVSLRLTNQIILDYEHKYLLVQAKQKELQSDEVKHRVLIRLSFSR